VDRGFVEAVCDAGLLEELSLARAEGRTQARVVCHVTMCHADTGGVLGIHSAYFKREIFSSHNKKACKYAHVPVYANIRVRKRLEVMTTGTIQYGANHPTEAPAEVMRVCEVFGSSAATRLEIDTIFLVPCCFSPETTHNMRRCLAANII
jgi:hypothetical protein